MHGSVVMSLGHGIGLLIVSALLPAPFPGAQAKAGPPPCCWEATITGAINKVIRGGVATFWDDGPLEISLDDFGGGTGDQIELNRPGGVGSPGSYAMLKNTCSLPAEPRNRNRGDCSCVLATHECGVDHHE